MKIKVNKQQAGFSLLELLIAMTIMLGLLSVATMLFSRAMNVRSRESRKADALTSSQAALNVLSREIANSGFGILSGSSLAATPSNGIILADSNASRIHIRANVTNEIPYSSAPSVGQTSDPGEDLTYFLDATSGSIVRYDPNAIAPTPQVSIVVNRISNLRFQYVNYTFGSSATTTTSTPTATTGRVIITVEVQLAALAGEPTGQTVTFTSDVTLRNSNYILQQY